jgi:DNA adenine methylase
MHTSTPARPFIKWVGGKTQLLPKFHELYPPELSAGEIRTYREPFLGGGAVFFDVVQHFSVGSAQLYDINEELILTYQVVQRDVEQLIEFLDRYASAYLALGPEKQKEFFFDFRANYNQQRFNIDFRRYSESWIPRAAQLIFLNKTCFNGLYRVNSKGEFNTPSGVYKDHQPRILDEDNLRAAARVLGIAEVRRADFTEVKTGADERTFIYFDPPYRPISKTASFNRYAANEFDEAHQRQLADLFHALDRQGAQLMLSNSDPKNIEPADDFFDRLYADFHITRVQATRLVNSKAHRRGLISEIVVRNF